MSDAPKPSKARYFLYAFAAMLLLTAAGVGFLVWKLTPLMEVDEKNDQVRFLGGYIQINGKEGSLQVGKKRLDAVRNDRHFEGKTEFHVFGGGHGPFAAENAQLLIRMRNGNLELTTADGNWLEWKCDTSPLGTSPEIQQVRSQMVLDFSHGPLGRCRVALPARLTVAVDIRGGRLDAIHPRFDLRLEAETSKVIYTRDPALTYAFESRLEGSHLIGQQKLPPNSGSADAVWAGLTVRYGSIAVE